MAHTDRTAPAHRDDSGRDLRGGCDRDLRGGSGRYLDDALIGRWGSAPFDLGAMETSEVEFLADGRGRMSLMNAFEEDVTRFRWHCPEPGVVELREEDGTVTRHRYRVGAASPTPGAAPLTAVHFDEPLAFCHQFAKSG